MKIKVLLIVISILIISNIYTLYQYSINEKKITCCTQKYKDASNGIKLMLQMNTVKSLENLSLLLNNQDQLKLILHADSSIYLEALGNQDYSIYKPIDSNSTLCYFWTKKTKQQYKETYLEITKLQDFNNTHKAMLKGLDIVNTTCLGRWEITPQKLHPRGSISTLAEKCLLVNKKNVAYD